MNKLTSHQHHCFHELGVQPFSSTNSSICFPSLKMCLHSLILCGIIFLQFVFIGLFFKMFCFTPILTGFNQRIGRCPICYV